MADSVRALIEGLEARFQPSAVEGVEAVCQFDIKGPDGGEWYADIHHGRCLVREGRAPAPSITITARDVDLLRLVRGEIDGRFAFLTGKLKVTGDLGLATRLRRAFGW